MSVLFLSSDLIFSSRLAAAGQRLGVEVCSVSSVDAAVTRLQGGSIGVVICDLSSGVDAQIIVERLRQSQPGLPIVAFAPHVHEERLRAATEAGCDEVLSRGQFDRQMDAVLKRYADKM